MPAQGTNPIVTFLSGWVLTITEPIAPAPTPSEVEQTGALQLPHSHPMVDR